MVEAVVIGGGVVGASIAYHLVSEGAKTILIDRHDVGRATDAGAGILSPETNTRDGQDWFEFAVRAVGYYPGLIQRLETEQSGDTGYARCGKLTVAVSEDEVEPFERASEVIFNRQRDRGLPSTEELYAVTPEVAGAMFPPLASVYRALYYRQAARVDGRLLARALLRAAEAKGLMVKRSSVEKLLLQNRQVTGVESEGDIIRAGGVAIAGGAWSHQFGVQLGVQIPVQPQRGQIIHLNMPETDMERWPIISAFRGHYIVPWSDNKVVVGATREVGSGFSPATTAVGVLEVLSEALRVAPGLAEAQIREIRVGLRPMTADLLPVLGQLPGAKNIYLATGHGPTGLQLGPYSGKIIADMILGRSEEADISAFQVTRLLGHG